MRKLRLAGIWLLLLCLLTGCQGGAAAAEDSPAVEVEAAASEVPAVTDAPVDGMLTVYYLDVGEGNAALIESQGHFMLVDGGDRDYSSKVVAVLKSFGVETLDYVIVSHFDADHLNGIVGALHVFPVDTVLAPDYTADTNIYRSYVSIMQEKGLAAVTPQVGDAFAFGDASFTVVGPTRYDHADVNDNSIAIRLVFGGNSFLFTGDAEAGSESEILSTGQDLDVDVLEAGHHGSDSSTSQGLLDAASPEAVVVSCGAGNSYGHPAQAVMERLQAKGVTLFRTDVQGDISVTSDGVNLTWNAEPTTDWSYGSGGTDRGAEDAVAEDTWDDSVKYDSVGDTNTSAAYILNTHTRKFHLPDCPSAEKISVKNYAESNESRDQLIAEGYSPCGNCKP
ncbi:MAG: ComEC/Rec2 family competence protein [Lachnospiraceae bacterium]|nr:ComEC/Rec2 family competence protein [Lachnospiraceae bacterium]